MSSGSLSPVFSRHLTGHELNFLLLCFNDHAACKLGKENNLKNETFKYRIL